MSKRTKAEWKAKQQWQADLDARHAEQERRQTIKRLTSDLPVNSRISIDIVDDPLSSRGEKIPVVRSTRDDPLADMLSRGVIDIAMFNAGRRWQAYYEAIEIGPISAMDPTKEPVDGRGPAREPITDRQQEAVDKIAHADMVLGQTGAAIIRKLLAESKSMGQLCQIFGCDTARKANFLSVRVRECLEDLGKLWGFVGHQRRAS